MTNFKQFLKLELYLFRQKKFYVTVLIITIIALLSTALGIADYRLNSHQVYQINIDDSLENFGSSQYPTGLTNLSLRVFRMSNRSASSIFFPNDSFPPSSSKLLSHFNFSDTVLYLGSLLALLMGIGPHRHTEFIKMTASRTSIYAAFLYSALARLLILAALALGLFLLSTGVAAAAVSFGAGDFGILAGLALEALLMLTFFFAAGCSIGYRFLNLPAKSRHAKSLSLAAAAWLIFAVLIPSGDCLSPTNAIPEPGETLPISFAAPPSLLNYSRPPFSNDDYGFLSPWLCSIGYVPAEPKKLNIRGRRVKLSLKHFFPSTFYRAVCADLNSKCRRDYAVVYCKTAVPNRTFFPRPDADSSFRFNDDGTNLYIYAAGIAANWFLVSILSLPAFFLFKQKLALIPSSSLREIPSPDTEIYPGDIKSWTVKSPLLANLWFNLLSGRHKWLRKKGFDGNIRIDDVDIMNHGFKGEFFYLCRPELIPKHLKAENLLSFFSNYPGSCKENSPAIYNIINKSFRDLTPEERLNTLIAISNTTKKQTVFVFHDTFLHLPQKTSAYAAKLKDLIDLLEENDHSVILLAGPESIAALMDKKFHQEEDFCNHIDLYYLTAYHQRKTKAIQKKANLKTNLKTNIETNLETKNAKPNHRTLI